MTDHREPRRKEPVGLCVALITLGGFHYGYNVAVVGAAKDGLTDAYAPTTETFSLLSAAALLGAVIGSPLSGLVCSRFGRRIGTFVGESLSVAGALGSGLSTDMSVVISCRVAIGLGVGFCTLAKPLYVREVLSDEHVSSVQASFAPTVALGILAAQASPSVTSSWRLQLIFGGVPPLVLFLVALVWMRESPVWLASRVGTRAASSEAAADEQRQQPASELAPSTAPNAEQNDKPQTTSINVSDPRLSAGSDDVLLPHAPRRPTCPPMALAALLGIANQLTGAYPILVYARLSNRSNRAGSVARELAPEGQRRVPLTGTRLCWRPAVTMPRPPSTPPPRPKTAGRRRRSCRSPSRCAICSARASRCL